jgi:hypothetical protein
VPGGFADGADVEYAGLFLKLDVFPFIPKERS